MGFFRLGMVGGALLGVVISARAEQAGEWPNVGNDKGGMRYSTLTGINKQNVKDLVVAWTYHTGDAGQGTTIECTPLVVDGAMYVTTVKTQVVALDAASGKQIWKYDPYAGPAKPWIRASGGVNRGVAYWSDGAAGGQRRVILGAADGRIISLDASSGLPDPSFADNGTLDLRKGIDRDLSKLPYGPTSAPAVFENLVIVGCSNSETQPSAPGDIRAFDVRTGKEVWRFHTVPHPGEFGNETWQGEEWKDRGGANPWGGFTVDAQNGILFCGTGSVTPDFFGRDRKGTNLFGNCVLALDIRTGSIRRRAGTGRGG
jgi:quinoprotein glucose dehydrogenase